jgi:hypothetical protein
MSLKEFMKGFNEQFEFFYTKFLSERWIGTHKYREIQAQREKLKELTDKIDKLMVVKN